MKKLIKRSILFIALLSAIFVIVSCTQSNSCEKEVMLIEVYINGVNIFHNDKPTEFIDMDIPLTMEEITERGEIIKSALQKLYNDGWKLEVTNGGDQIQRYILTK